LRKISELTRKLTDVKHWDNKWGSPKLKKRGLDFKLPIITEVAKSIDGIVKNDLACGNKIEE